MSEILLESGTNELEIVEFYINQVRFGVNVTKVEEVRYMPKYRKMPQASQYILGFFNLRGKVIPIIDLPKILETDPLDATKSQVIIMHFNERIIGFLVEKVVKIIRLSWTNIIPPPVSFNNDQVIGVIIEPGREKDLIQLIDFERIMEGIAPSFTELDEAYTNTSHEELLREDIKVWIAEDSKMIQQIVAKGLDKAGYLQQRWFTNGKDCWEAIEKLDDVTMPESIDVLVTDIEMPQMDGLHLAKRIKENSLYRNLPLIMFSSLINENTIHKCRSVGADSQVAKPDVEQLVYVMDELLMRYRSNH